MSLKRITGEMATPFAVLFPRRMQEGAWKMRPVPVHPETSVPAMAVSSVAPFKSLDGSPVAPHPALKVEKFSNRFVCVAAPAGAERRNNAEAESVAKRRERVFMRGKFGGWETGSKYKTS